ncbi:hypothetical protein [Saccharopolyspora sp. 5N708]|uniref:hypothetical protein n=1 Tax=Saccharopolyspora sp. 5N708 TaxID=3457424 RepID=UPI003FD242BB
MAQAKTDAEKRAMLGGADDGDLLLVAWPGEWSQDVFVVDDVSAARVALGLPRHRVVPEPQAGQPRPVPAGHEMSVRPADLWSCLAGLPELPVEGQFQIAGKFAGHWTPEVASALLRRPDLDSRARQRLIADASRWVAPVLISDESCSASEVLELHDRFSDSAEVLQAALCRADTKPAAQQKLMTLPYVDAARLWLDSRAWSTPKRPELASAILAVVLDSEPVKPLAHVGYGSDRYERSALVRSLADDLSAEQRLELLRNPQYGALVQQAFLAGDELPDDELIECLPEITKPHSATSPDSVPALVQYVQRFPQLIGTAGDQVRAAAAWLVADGWSPIQAAARDDQWDALVTLARIADAPEPIDALVRAAVFDRDRPAHTSPTPRWREPRRYELVDLLLNNPAISEEQIRYLLERLSSQHVEEIQYTARKRSRISRLCSEVLRARHPETEASAYAASALSPAPLPTDEELSGAPDPTAVLRNLLRDRGQHRRAIVDHALNSIYMTDELAWRLPVQELERHPVYGPRLAAEITEICGNSPSRWQVFADSWARPTQLLATTLFKRLKAADT